VVESLARRPAILDDGPRALNPKGETSRMIPRVVREHPLPFLLAGAVLVAAALHLLVFRGREWPAPVDLTIEQLQEEARAEAEAAAAEAAGPDPWRGRPVRAFDDFQTGVHLRYPEEWTERGRDELPPGPPGQLLVAVGPPESEAALAVLYIGPTVPRTGIEAIARRTAEMAGAEVRGQEVVRVHRTEALRVTISGPGGEEEAAYLNHLGRLLVVRLVAPDAAGLEEVRAGLAALRID
jgi:hypothetical protein